MPDRQRHSGTYTIGKKFRFEAAHHIDGFGPDHKCAHNHGHSFQIELTLTALALTPPGVVTDFGQLAAFRRYLKQNFDHHDLNTVLSVQPTCENIAAHLADWFVDNVEDGIPGQLTSVQVTEGDSWARYDLEPST